MMVVTFLVQGQRFQLAQLVFHELPVVVNAMLLVLDFIFGLLENLKDFVGIPIVPVSLVHHVHVAIEPPNDFPHPVLLVLNRLRG